MKKAKNIVPQRYLPDPAVGLTAQQAALRREEKLLNARPANTSQSYLSIILSNVFTFFNMLWAGIAVVLIYFKAYDNLFFLIIVGANLFIGTFQELRSKRALEKLKLDAAPPAEIVRDGKTLSVPSDRVALDDILLLSTGNHICSDCVLVSGTAEVNESMLTGESVPVRKKEGELLFAGSFLTSGSCVCRVDRVGADNYVQQLAKKAKKFKKPQSQLMKSLRALINIIAILLIPLGLIALGMNVRTYAETRIFPLSELFAALPALPDENIFKIVTKTAGAIVGMIPSGMYLLTSMALAAGVIRLTKHRTLVQDLYSIEMLARTSTLCLDKTGTITDGTMAVKSAVPLGKGAPPVSDIVSSIVFATKDNNQTARAVAAKYGIDAVYKAEASMPFSSARKYSAITCDGVTYAMGAAEFMMKRIPKNAAAHIDAFSRQGCRVLLVASAEGALAEDGSLPAGLKPLYVIAIEDHIRENACATITWFKENGVNIKIISGDNPLTVSVIAGRVGVENAERYISLDGMSDSDVTAAANQYTVFGRVSPDQKALLVQALRRNGETVAMTGDGVNDILALKEADCSVVMASGSDAARGVANLVLLDSDFGSMPQVVAEGRRVINNIQKSSALFLMKTFFVLLIVPLLALFNSAYPFTAKQMVPLEVLAVGAPAFFLALQPNTDRISGHFLVTVFKKALPAGLTMVFNILVINIFYGMLTDNFGLSRTDVDAICMIVTTFAGFEMLLLTCRPFNKYRTVVYCVFFAAWIVMLLAIPQFFEIGSISLVPALIAAGLVLLDFPILIGLTYAANKVRIN